ncbi:MAG: mannose-1-phosphate guanylyltransferase/mannose-6-phosphate isomerase [Bdellovibrionota bacterium]|nr:mannose-1-phosphate guanylyltransferase/mannose-6-phosphate isomerase [Bdellovibrionota bacterium]
MIPVIMSGGSGTRLWPLSREKYPKQFCDLMEESLMTKTLLRLQKLGEARVITTERLRVLTEQSLLDLNLKGEHTLYEPSPRNTAPAVALVCRQLQLENKLDEIVGIFPADHIIENETEFLKAIELAQKVAETKKIVTLGIKPKFPATGYGYIETNDSELDRLEYLKAYSSLGFREKPAEETASEYLRKGNFFWNAGIFVFQVKHMISMFEEHANDIWQKMLTLKSDFSNLEEVYAGVRSESVDYAIMENTKEIACVPCDIGWSDLGSWDEVAKHFDRKLGSGGVDMSVQAENNFVFSNTSKAVALVGVSDLIVVDTGDTLLVCKKGESQKVKQVVQQLKDKHYSIREHLFEHRPWGKYTVLQDEPEFKAKRIVVNPGQRLSYQSHEKRSEHWVLIKGSAVVVLDGKEYNLEIGDSIEIPRRAKHRMENKGSKLVEFVEIQTGEYFGEDDIVRYSDDYGRT